MALKQGLVALAVAVGALLFVSGNGGVARAADIELEVESNPVGTNFPTIYGVQPSWVMDGDSLKVCSDWGTTYSDIPLPIRDAIDDWEDGALPGDQLNPTCFTSGTKLWLRRATASVGFPLGCADLIACVRIDYAFDSLRSAFYPADSIIWFNDMVYTFADDGWRFVAGHELGHIFGLDEAYIHPGFVCNGAVYSVMNSADAPGNNVTGPCKIGGVTVGSLVPTQRDIDLVQGLFQVEPPPSTGWTISMLAPYLVQMTFLDENWAEGHYGLYTDRWDGSQWLPVDAFTWHVNVGRIDVSHTVNWEVPPVLPAAFYRVCADVRTEVYGASPVVCNPQFFFMTPDSDADGDGWGDSTDNCPNWFNTTQLMPPWTVPETGDPDCDGYASTSWFFARASEAFLGTHQTKKCAATPNLFDERGPAYGEPLSPWPPDLNDSGMTTNGDALAFSPHFNAVWPDPAYSQRFDLNGDLRVSLADVLQISPFFNLACGAF